MENRKCDFCGIGEGDELIYSGRWIIYCKLCEDKGGKEADEEKTYNNEVLPILETGDFSNMDGELQDIIAIL